MGAVDVAGNALVSVSPVIHFGLEADVTVGDLRNHGGEVFERVERGETMVVTRDGRPVAELRPLRRPSVDPGELIRRGRHLPHVDAGTLGADINALINQRL